MTELVKLFNKTMIVITIILNLLRIFLENHVFDIHYSVKGISHVFTFFFEFWWFIIILLFLGYTISAIVALHRLDHSRKDAGK